MCFFRNYVKKLSSLKMRLECQEAILLYKNCIEFESVQRVRRDCLESMLFYKNRTGMNEL